MVIDVHCHIGRGDFLDDPFQLEAILEQQQEAGVERTVVFSHKRRNYRVANEEIAEMVSRHPSLIGFARVAASSDGAPEELDYAIRKLGLKGVKSHIMDGFPTPAFMDKVDELGVPVLFHSGMGTPPSLFEPIAKRYPNVTVILAHLGTELTWANMLEYPEQAMRLAAEYDNVYVDTSAVYVLNVLKRAVNVCGPSKMLLGSDGPWLFHPAIAIRQIELLNLTEGEKQAVLGGNSARILGL
jgi:predicted TIM-barrel fold metal-dependent hydrolase